MCWITKMSTFSKFQFRIDWTIYRYGPFMQRYWRVLLEILKINSKIHCIKLIYKHDIYINFKVLYICFIYREQRWIFDTEVGYFPGQLTLISTGLFFLWFYSLRMMTFLWFSVTILFYSINVKTQSDLRIYVN